MRREVSHFTENSMHRYTRHALLAIAAAGLWLAGSTAEAQGKSHKKNVKVISTTEGVVIAREILVKHGYEVVRVDIVEDTRVIYYRLGNRGRGKGKGRLQKIVVRREPERIVFIDAPPTVQVDINVRLGL
jgi:uncharacterized protein (UPF0548 family)